MYSFYNFSNRYLMRQIQIGKKRKKILVTIDPFEPKKKKYDPFKLELQVSHNISLIIKSYLSYT
jgi:hypothetical protein